MRSEGVFQQVKKFHLRFLARFHGQEMSYTLIGFLEIVIQFNSSIDGNRIYILKITLATSIAQGLYNQGKACYMYEVFHRTRLYKPFILNGV